VGVEAAEAVLVNSSDGDHAAVVQPMAVRPEAAVDEDPVPDPRIASPPAFD
jgi:hypothetical protein